MTKSPPWLRSVLLLSVWCLPMTAQAADVTIRLPDASFRSALTRFCDKFSCPPGTEEERLRWALDAITKLVSQWPTMSMDGLDVYEVSVRMETP